MRARTNRWLAAVAVAVLPAFAHADAPGAAGSVRVVIGFWGKPDRGLVERHGGTVALEIPSARALAARLPLSAIERLQAEGAVASVEPDGEAAALGKPAEAGGGKPLPPQPDEQLPWGIQQIRANVAWGLATGAGVRVAVIDTGIDDAHPDLAGHVEMGANFVSGKPPRDDNGHGTHVAGTVGAAYNAIGVIGVGPEIRLYAVKVLDRRGSGWWSAVAAGIDWAAANGMHVASMSLGGGASDLVSVACENAERSGVILVAAAGNSGNAAPGGSTVAHPAAYPSVIAVSATDWADRIASFSSTGPKVELAAPGVNVLSTVPGGKYAYYSGTSMAAPHVSGTAALAISRGIVTDANGNGRLNDEIRALLQATARDVGAAGRDPLFGFGVVNADASVR